MAKPKLPYDALIFDVGGVTVRHDNERLFRRLAASCRVADAVDRIRVAAMDPAITTGTREVRALHQDLVGTLGYARDWNGFLSDWSSHFAVDRGMIDLLAALARDNRVVLFSNTNREHWDYVTTLADGALGRYEAYLSHEIHDLKPRASAFRLVAARAGVAPPRVLFVDDLVDNIAAARALGFVAHHFTDRDEFEKLIAAANEIAR